MMRRLLSLTFVASAALATLLLIALVVLWAVSHARPFDHRAASGAAVYELTVAAGGASLTMRADRSVNRIRMEEYEFGRLVLHYGIDEGWTGPGAPGGQSEARLFYWRLGAPLWLMAALAAVLPAWALMRLPGWRRERARRRGRCPVCGYDLRASRAACPECGEPVAEQSPHEQR